MARIPDTEIERLKSEVSLARLVEAAGVELERRGHDLVGACPFCDQPSRLIVSPDKNLWRCSGACDAGGSVIDWAMKVRGISFRHAVELLREDASLVVTDRAVKRGTVRSLPAPVTAEGDDAQLLSQVVGYYHETLKQSPEALAYLQSRGIVHSEVIDAFKLGYANRTLGLRLPEKNRVSGEAIRTRLQKLGLIRDTGHEHFNGALVIPVVDESGRVVQLYGRKIGERLRDGTALHLTLPGPLRGVWNAPALAGSEEVILCKGLVDALTFWVSGYRNVTATFGADRFTDEHLTAFKHAGIKRVLIAFDRSEAGDQAAQLLAKKLTGHGFDAFRIRFPHGLDANTYALKVQPAAKSLGVAIRGAEWLGKGEKPQISSVPVPPVLVPVPASPSDSPLAASVHEAAAPQAPPPEPPAYRLPPPASTLPVELVEHELRLTLGDRQYRVRGIDKNLSNDRLSVWLRVIRGEHFHVDVVDLVQAKPRQAWVRQAAIEMGVSEEVAKSDLAKVQRAVEDRQDQVIREQLQPQREQRPELTVAEREAGLSLLRDPNLLARIVADVEALGVVGERSNALVSYLACVSRRLRRPLAILIQSTSAAGKSTLMDAVLSLMPDTERMHYSAMTSQSLFYLGQEELKHKILAVAEEEGVRQAAYALKILQSQGELTIASTGKDPLTGKLTAQPYRVEGPVMLFLTTTAIDLDDELQNRCLTLTINETPEQTAAIHTRQRARRTLAGLYAEQTAESIRQRHRAAQQLLEPIAVVNPYADQLTFRIDATRLRRDHEHYLTLIESIAFLHQHQREKRTGIHDGKPTRYIEVTLADIGKANELAHEMLGRSLDELPPQTRRLLGLIAQMVAERCKAEGIERSAYRFTRKDVRDFTHWGDTQLKVHLARLVDLDYVLPSRNAHAQRQHYELIYAGQGESGERFLMGLIDVDALTTQNRSGLEANRSASGRPPVGGRSAPGLGEEKGPKSNGHTGIPPQVAPTRENARPRPRALVVS